LNCKKNENIRTTYLEQFHDSTITIWKNDKGGCLCTRYAIKEQILNANLSGMTKKEIIYLLGQPDIDMIIDQSFYYYTNSLCGYDTSIYYIIKGRDTIAKKEISKTIGRQSECIFVFKNDTLDYVYTNDY
jgi:hypothetical protein